MTKRTAFAIVLLTSTWIAVPNSPPGTTPGRIASSSWVYGFFAPDK